MKNKMIHYLIANLKCPIQKSPNIEKLLSKEFPFIYYSLKNKEITYSLIRRSIDARKKNQLCYNFTVILHSIKDIPQLTKHRYNYPQEENLPMINANDKNVFIIGMGPAGLFCALELVKRGYTPIIFERGKAIEERNCDVDLFWKNATLNTESNVQFGEGGAGTFSDGKLTARNRSVYSEKVFEYLIEHGADTDIMINALPHLGTDGLKNILLSIRNYLLSKNCTINFTSKFEDLIVKDNKVQSIKINGISYQPEHIILALGNSARDSFEILYKRGIQIESKPFAVGFRIEHPQAFINERFYGKNADYSVTGPATYGLTAQSCNYGVYSFCMCPGGYVIPAASEEAYQVVNGMSLLKRNNEFANSAIVASVNEKDFGTHPLDGIKFQRLIESKAFANYNAPAQKAEDFINNKISAKLGNSSYTLNLTSTQLSEIFSKNIGIALKDGLSQFNQKVEGFIQNGVLIAPETRTSCPIRIVRHQDFAYSLSASNLFPIGEGAGYAGGIISSATDGIKCAMRFPDQS